MILQYFKKKENEYKQIADNIYISILYKSKLLIKENHFREISFNSSFEIISIILIFYLKVLKQEKEYKYKKINDELIKILIQDLDKSLRELGIGDMSLGKYVKKYVKKFYYRLSVIDKIFDNYNEKKFIDYLISLKNINEKNTQKLSNRLNEIYLNIKKDKEII